MNPEDDWIDRWKTTRHADVPEVPADFTDRVLDRLGASEPVKTPQPSLALWMVRVALALLTTALVMGRLVANAAIFFTSSLIE